MIWHIYSGQYCFKGVLGMDLLSSGDVALTMGQVSCEFWADWPTFIFQPAGPDMIWHIYLHLYCSSRNGGSDLPSSGRQPLPWGRFPVSFGQIGQTSFSESGSLHDFSHLLTPVLLLKGWWHWLAVCRGGQPLPWGRSPVSFEQISLCVVFQGRVETRAFQPCPAQDGASSMGGGSGCDLAHLLWAALLQGGFRYGPAVFKGWCPHDWAGPLWVSRRSANLYFSASSSWCDSAHLLWTALLQGILGMDLLSSGNVVLIMGQVPCEFRADWPNFIFQPAAPDMIWHISVGRVEGMDLPSSGDVVLTRGLVVDLPQTKEHLPWRQQVDGTIPH